MLTFETLSRISREEKSSQSLTKLPEEFFQEVSRYISKKVQLKEGEDSWELENAKMVLNDIMRSRDRKIALSALGFADTGVEPVNLAPEEKRFFDSLAELMMGLRAERKAILQPDAGRHAIIAFLQDVPLFVGLDLKGHGPFEKGDVANLPEELANVLVDRGAARRMGPKPEQPAEAI